MDDADLLPVGFELVGDNAGQGGADVLAHLGPDDIDRHHAVRVDGVPEGGLEGGRPGKGAQGDGGVSGGGEAEGRARCTCRDQESAAVG